MINIFENISGENLHHAYLVVGDLEASREHVLNFLTTLSVVISGNPDVRHLKYDTFTKELSGDLVLAVAQKSFSSPDSSNLSNKSYLSYSKKIFIIETNIITEEAQNALLKVFEEPTAGTHFFILMPQDILLPTLRSRMQIIQQGSPLSYGITRGTLVDLPISERLAMIKEITDGISDEEKTKQDAIALLNQIESELYSRGVEKESEKLKLCQLTRSALYDRGAPVKMILENLMIAI